MRSGKSSLAIFFLSVLGMTPDVYFLMIIDVGILNDIFYIRVATTPFCMTNIFNPPTPHFWEHVTSLPSGRPLRGSLSMPV